MDVALSQAFVRFDERVQHAYEKMIDRWGCPILVGIRILELRAFYHRACAGGRE